MLRRSFIITGMLLAGWAAGSDRVFAEPPGGEGLTLSWADNYLVIRGDRIPGGPIRIHYLEAYCRADSTDADWVEHTTVGHETELIAADDDGKRIELRCTLRDGVIVEHVITADEDEVDFRLVAHNSTGKRSEAHWAQPCIRVGDFTGLGQADTPDAYRYITRGFIFLDGELARMPTEDWATEARYTPGQVWRPSHVPESDVNPRPLNPHTPSNGLIGCFGGENEEMVLATAWEPYQELFQGVARCLHSDFRLGGLEPGETKKIRGKIYIVPSDIPPLLERYERDFPEHRQ